MADQDAGVPDELQNQDYFAHLRMPTDPNADAWADLEPEGTDFETDDAPGADTNASVRESVESSLEAEDEAHA
ncbi:MAG: hypothetical protein ACLGHZ_04750 [Actinomycetes bacterium]